MSDELFNSFKGIFNPKKMEDDNKIIELVDLAHTNAYLCALSDGRAAMEELEVPSKIRLAWLSKMEHMLSVREATKFTTTTDEKN